MEKLQLVIDQSDPEFSLSDPQVVSDFLEKMNAKYGLNITIDLEDINKKLKTSNNAQRKMNFDRFNELAAGKKPPIQEDNVVVGEPRVLFKKTLTATDTSVHQHRLLIPRNILLIENFFTEREVTDMWSSVDVPAKLIGPDGDEKYDVCFRIQNRNDKTKPISYIIPNPWPKIVKANNLVAGMEVQMTAWRNATGTICLQLAKL